MLRLVLTFLLALGTILASAQRSHFIQHSTQDGLAQSQVRAICQDKKGFLWLGTLNGLSRYDGFSFKNYTVDDGLPDRTINTIFQGTSYLWVGTKGSLSRLVHNKLESINLPQGYEDSKILTLAEDQSGRLWLGLNGGGILIYDGSRFTSLRSSDGLPNDFVRKLYLTKSGEMLIGTRAGMVSWYNDELNSFKDSTLQNISVSDILTTKSGNLVVSTFGDGILILRGNKVYQLNYDNGFPTNHVRSLVQIKEGFLWFGSRSGLYELNLQNFSCKPALGLDYENIKSLGTDREQNLWIGTDGQGLYQKAGSAFVLYGNSEGMKSELITAVTKDEKGNIIFGTYDQGIETFDGQDFQSFNLNGNLPSETVWSLSYAKNGNLWVGTSRGLFIQTPTGYFRLNSESGLPGNEITSILQSKGKFFVGAEKGFGILNSEGEILKVYDSENGFEGENIRSIINTDKGLYLGAKGGVYKKINSTFKELKIPSQRDVAIYCLEHFKNRIWIGTSEGLYTADLNLDSISKVRLDQEAGAANINFLEKLPTGSLLAGTNHGLYSISQPANELEINHYSEYEGLPSMESNQNSSFFDGIYVWFGTTSGTVQFDPRNVAYGKKYPPEINISDIELYLQTPDWNQYTDSISNSSGLPYSPTIPHTKNYLTFNYVGIQLGNPEKVLYRYRLLGEDDEWLGPTPNKTITYAYLPHGSYDLEIEAFSKDDPKNISKTEFAFTITPPFYLTWWFFAICAIIIAAIVYLLYRRRIKKELEKRANLQLKFQSRLMELESQSLNSSMNRHFIFNALNSIQYYINLQDRKSANKYLTSFARLIRMNLDSSQENETVLKDELERLELYLDLEKMRFQGKFDYVIEIEDQVNTESVSIPAMMLQPFLENSIWHGILPSKKFGIIKIIISKGVNEILIQIDDNGIGFQTSLKTKNGSLNGHTSKGMDITQNRIDLYRRMTGLKYKIEGPQELKAEDEKVLGTRVIIRLPLGNELLENPSTLVKVLNN